MVDTAIVRDQLNVLVGTVADKYTPLWFRQALSVDTVVPAWAQMGTYTKISVASDMKLASYFDTSVPLASHKRTSRSFNVLEFINGYRIGRKELDRAAADPSYQLEAALALANQRKAESTLQAIAMTGGGYGGLEGILTLTDSSTIDPTDSGDTSSDSFVSTDGAVISGTTVAYAISWFDELYAAYLDVAGDGVIPNVCIVPSLQAKGLKALRDDYYVSAWAKIQEEHPETTFYISKEANDAGGPNVCRTVLFSRDPDVAQMVVPEEYHDLDPFSEPVGSIIVPSTMSTGGVISNFPTAVLRAEVTIPAP